MALVVPGAPGVVGSILKLAIAPGDASWLSYQDASRPSAGSTLRSSSSTSSTSSVVPLATVTGTNSQRLPGPSTTGFVPPAPVSPPPPVIPPAPTLPARLLAPPTTPAPAPFTTPLPLTLAAPP